MSPQKTQIPAEIQITLGRHQPKKYIFLCPTSNNKEQFFKIPAQWKHNDETVNFITTLNKKQ